ncbi:MAG: hypothetical protein ACI9UT_003308 [Flavobacteriales bacterium]|jgi:hypothetical protein
MLKPVKDFINLLENTFQKGPCTCMRCVSDEDPLNYNTAHNFEMHGEVYRRLFINSSKDDLSTKMKAALKSEYKDQVFDFTVPFDETIITDFFDQTHFDKFVFLGKANGLIKQVSEGNITFYPL